MAPYAALSTILALEGKPQEAEQTVQDAAARGLSGASLVGCRRGVLLLSENYAAADSLLLAHADSGTAVERADFW